MLCIFYAESEQLTNVLETFMLCIFYAESEQLTNVLETLWNVPNFVTC
jgi:hypothetical protein